MGNALDGTRILDMSGAGPGTFSATIFADLGAELIKVHEPKPRPGSMMANVFPQAPGYPGRRNFKSIGIDLRIEDGKRVFYDLVKTADVVVDGFRPGTTKVLGVDYETLSRINPRIVCASLTAFGHTGPYRDMVGHDLNSIAMGGLLETTRRPGEAPVIPGTFVADFAGGGMSAVIGVLAALLAREKTGEGQFLDISMTDPVVELMGSQIMPYMTGRRSAAAGFTRGEWPFYNVYKAKDGKYVSVACVEPWMWKNFCELVGHPELIDHEYADGERREETFKVLRGAFLTKTRDEWVNVLRQKDTCVAPVYALDEIPSDPHLKARQMIVELEHPTLGKVKQIGSAVKLSDSQFGARYWGQRFGQNTDEILRGAGYSEERIAELRKAGAIG